MNNRGAIIAAALMLGATSCAPAAPDVTASPTPTIDATPEKPAPQYIEHKGGVYYYSAAVSENDQKSGQAAGEVVGFRYLGRNSDGDYILQQDGTPRRATCSDPCRVIHYNLGPPLAYEPGSVIGAAMTDALNGNLEISKHEGRK